MYYVCIKVYNTFVSNLLGRSTGVLRKNTFGLNTELKRVTIGSVAFVNVDKGCIWSVKSSLEVMSSHQRLGCV